MLFPGWHALWQRAKLHRNCAESVEREKRFEVCRMQFLKLAKSFVFPAFRRDFDSFSPSPESTPVHCSPPESTRVLEKLEKRASQPMQ